MTKARPYHTCEYCGALRRQMAQRDVGAVSWGLCPACVPLVDAALRGEPRPSRPFGAPVETLEAPKTSVAWWLGYRLACDDLGYTSLTAASRAERDALSTYTNRWLNAILGLRYAIGQVQDNPAQGFVVTHFRQHLRDQFGTAPPGAMARRAWLLGLLTATGGLRASDVPTHMAVPKPGALRPTTRSTP